MANVKEQDIINALSFDIQELDDAIEESFLAGKKEGSKEAKA